MPWRHGGGSRNRGVPREAHQRALRRRWHRAARRLLLRAGGARHDHEEPALDRGVQVPGGAREDCAACRRLAGRKGRHADPARHDGPGACRRHHRAPRDAPQHRGDPAQGHPHRRPCRHREGGRDHPAGGRADRGRAHGCGGRDRAACHVPCVRRARSHRGPKGLLPKRIMSRAVPGAAQVVRGPRPDEHRRSRRAHHRPARRCGPRAHLRRPLHAR